VIKFDSYRSGHGEIRGARRALINFDLIEVQKSLIRQGDANISCDLSPKLKQERVAICAA
jgi:hypothetical protein